MQNSRNLIKETIGKTLIHKEKTSLQDLITHYFGKKCSKQNDQNIDIIKTSRTDQSKKSTTSNQT
jgi:hypothetical protein